MEQYMEDKCLYIRPNNKGLFDMNLICNIRLVENRPQVCYEITFMNKDILYISPEEYEDLLEQMTEEYSYYENDINEEEECDEYNDCANTEKTVCDYDALFKEDNKINW